MRRGWRTRRSLSSARTRRNWRRSTPMRSVHVALFDRAADAEYVYPAMILHAGLLAASDAAAGGLSFSPRRYGVRRGRCVASIGPERPIEQALLDSAQYFVTLRLGDLERDVTTDVAPQPGVMMRTILAEESPLLARLDADALERLFRGREPRVERAVVQTRSDNRNGAVRRSAVSDAPLVAMRILRRL